MNEIDNNNNNNNNNIENEKNILEELSSLRDQAKKIEHTAKACKFF